MKDNKGTERSVRYKAKFGQLPTEILVQILDYLTIWSLLSLKLTSVMHFVLLKKNFPKKGDYFHARRDRLFKPDQIDLFKLSWKNLLLRENAEPVLKKDMKQGILNIAESPNFLGIFEPYYRSKRGYMSFSMRTLSDALRTDCPKQFLECTTSLSNILKLLDMDKDGQDNEKLMQAIIVSVKKYDYYRGDFVFLILLPYVMRAGATACFEWSIRILACFSKYAETSLSESTSCLGFDTTGLIISSNIPYFMERYFYLLNSIFLAGHNEINDVIDKYDKNNQLSSIKNCLLKLSEAHLKVLKKIGFETKSKSLDALFPDLAASNELLAVPRSILMTRLSSLFVFLQENPAPSDPSIFRLKKMLLEEALEKMDHNLSAWTDYTNDEFTQQKPCI